MKDSRRAFPRSAFTLIELLTVIAIIGILAAIIIPTVGSVRNSARSAQAISNARQLWMANTLYSEENRGRILGEGVDWNDTVFLWNTFARYIAKAPGGDTTKTASILEPLADPMIPKELLIYGNTFPVTWSFNSVVNLRNGRRNQGLTSSNTPLPPGNARDFNARRVSDFREPSRLIYAVSGSYQFDATFAANEDLVNPPTARQRIFYVHRSGKATAAVFLDGHTQFLTYPIDPSLIIPSS